MILTCASEGGLAEVHERMPVVLRRDDWTEWLEPSTPRGRLVQMLKPFPPEVFGWGEADRAVGTCGTTTPHS